MHRTTVLLLAILLVLSGCIGASQTQPTGPLQDTSLELGGLEIFVTPNAQITTANTTYSVDTVSISGYGKNFSYAHNDEESHRFRLPGGDGGRFHEGTYTLQFTNSSTTATETYHITLTHRGFFLATDVTSTHLTQNQTTTPTPTP